jgi:hypothetical protein
LDEISECSSELSPASEIAMIQINIGDGYATIHSRCQHALHGI